MFTTSTIITAAFTYGAIYQQTLDALRLEFKCTTTPKKWHLPFSVFFALIWPVTWIIGYTANVIALVRRSMKTPRIIG